MKTGWNMLGDFQRNQARNQGLSVMNGKCQVPETGLSTAAVAKNMVQPPLIKGKAVTLPFPYHQ